MSTNIECTECHDTICMETRSVELPFVCNDCELRAAMAPIKPARVASFVTNGRHEEIDLAPEHAGLDEADATVENTTLLIEDLEEQVAAQKVLNDQANMLIEDMSKQLTEDAAVIGDNDRLIHGLEIGIEELNKTIVFESDRYTALYKMYHDANALNERLERDISAVIDRKNAGHEATTRFAEGMYILADEWDAEKADLEEQLKRAEDKLVIEKKEHAYKTKEYYTLYYSNERLRERGFFARLFNR
jgi:hypothetical protein